MSEVKLRAALKDGKCEVKALMTHPMETGRRKDPKVLSSRPITSRPSSCCITTS